MGKLFVMVFANPAPMIKSAETCTLTPTIDSLWRTKLAKVPGACPAVSSSNAYEIMPPGSYH